MSQLRRRHTNGEQLQHDDLLRYSTQHANGGYFYFCAHCILQGAKAGEQGGAPIPW